jgi:tellurium resistance protein TerZ
MIQLKKEDGPADLAGMTHMAVGVSWDPTSGSKGGVEGFLRRKRGTDLDLIAILKVGGDPKRLAGLDSLDPLQTGAVSHSGDNQTGAGAGDDETVTVDFKAVNASPVDEIVFVAAAFKKGSDFSKARNISFKVYDGSGGSTEQVADIWPSLAGRHNANAVAKATRTGGVWTLQVLDESGTIRQGDEQSLLNFARGK